MLKKKNKKKTTASNAVLTPTRRKSPHTKSKAAGMQECNRSRKLKKKPRSLVKRKQVKFKKDKPKIKN